MVWVESIIPVENLLFPKSIEVVDKGCTYRVAVFRPDMKCYTPAETLAAATQRRHGIGDNWKLFRVF
jgi:hypothetical protein